MVPPSLRYLDNQKAYRFKQAYQYEHWTTNTHTHRTEFPKIWTDKLKAVQTKNVWHCVTQFVSMSAKNFIYLFNFNTICGAPVYHTMMFECCDTVIHISKNFSQWNLKINFWIFVNRLNNESLKMRKKAMMSWVSKLNLSMFLLAI